MPSWWKHRWKTICVIARTCQGSRREAQRPAGKPVCWPWDQETCHIFFKTAPGDDSSFPSATMQTNMRGPQLLNRMSRFPSTHPQPRVTKYSNVTLTLVQNEEEISSSQQKHQMSLQNRGLLWKCKLLYQYMSSCLVQPITSLFTPASPCSVEGGLVPISSPSISPSQDYI